MLIRTLESGMCASDRAREFGSSRNEAHERHGERRLIGRRQHRIERMRARGGGHKMVRSAAAGVVEVGCCHSAGAGRSVCAGVDLRGGRDVLPGADAL